MRRSIHAFLERTVSHPSVAETTHAVMDGTYLLNGRRVSAFVVLDAGRRSAVYWDYGAKESQHDLVRIFEEMRTKGCQLVSATIDGHPAISRALVHVWPNINIQRCLIHIQRQGLMWCRSNPKRPDAVHLRKLFVRVLSISTEREAKAFLHDLNAWEQRYGKRLAGLPERGWVLSDLLRARSMLLKARPHLFCYLDDPLIPKTTNMAEGFFSRFKGLLRDHRGLSETHQRQAFEWFCARRR